MKKFPLTAFIVILLATMVALFACTKTPPTHPEEDDNQTEEPVDDGCEHEFAFEVKKAPTVKDLGEGKGVCGKCGLEASFLIPFLGEEGYEITVEPSTCTEKGKKTYTSVYGYGTFYEELPLNTHEYKVIDSKEPTCNEEGYRIKKCFGCNDEVRETVGVSAHKYEVKERVEADCSTTGYAIYRCIWCDNEYKVDGTQYGHVYGEGVHTGAVCPEYGFTDYACELCGSEERVYDGKLIHIYNSVGVCESCGVACKHDFDGYVCRECSMNIADRVREDGLFHCDDNGNGVFDAGERVYYGWYPNSAVTDRDRIAELNETQAGEDGYYVLDGEKYAKRDLDQMYEAKAHFADGTTVAALKRYGYYYRVEPICWTVVRTEEGRVMLISEQIIDTGDFLSADKFGWNKDALAYTLNGGTDYACAWAGSDLREYLNGEFCEKAFDERQKNMLLTAETDNSHATNYYQSERVTHANGQPTIDKVFLPAYTDLFGENDAYNEASEGRQRKPTDYAIGGGVNLSKIYENFTRSWYYTRSVGLETDNIGIIDYYGRFDTSGRLYAEKNDNGQTVKGTGVVVCVWLNTGSEAP